MPLSALTSDTRGPQVSPATQVRCLSQPLALHRGGVLSCVKVAYESWGQLNAARDNLILLFTGLSPSAHAASSEQDPQPGWWEWMIGPGKPIDTTRFYVLCVNSLGSCFGSTGPASLNAQTGKPYAVDFPDLSVEDIAAAAAALLEQMHIKRAYAVVGASMGGMSALAFARAQGAALENIVLISTAAASSPFAIAMRSLQREIVRNDPAWQGGRYAPGRGPLTGMRLARKLGMTSYRSAQEWDQRFARARVSAALSQEAFAPEFEVESYLEHHARRFTGQFDANCYLYLSRAMDRFDLHDGALSLADALRRSGLKRALVMGVQSDILFPLAQQQHLADGLEALGCEVRFHGLSSVQGHDAFLVDQAGFSAPVRDFFAGLS